MEDAVIGAVFLLSRGFLNNGNGISEIYKKQLKERKGGLRVSNDNLQCYISLRLIEAQNAVDEVFR